MSTTPKKRGRKPKKNVVYLQDEGIQAAAAASADPTGEGGGALAELTCHKGQLHAHVHAEQ